MLRLRRKNGLERLLRLLLVPGCAFYPRQQQSVTDRIGLELGSLPRASKPFLELASRLGGGQARVDPIELRGSTEWQVQRRFGRTSDPMPNGIRRRQVHRGGVHRACVTDVR